MNRDDDLNKARLEIDLKEMEIVFDQGHTRMAIVGQYTNLSVSLAGAIAATLGTLASTRIPTILYLIIPLPFFLFAFLTLREDLLMVHNDFYLYRLRQRILEGIGGSASDAQLRFLSDIKEAKMGNIAALSTVLSALRYGVSVFVALPCLIWYVRISFLSTGFWGAKRSMLFAGDVLFLALLVLGVLHLGRLHKVNEQLVPVSFRAG